jgi:hypothetical protein
VRRHNGCKEGYYTQGKEGKAERKEGKERIDTLGKVQREE